MKKIANRDARFYIEKRIPFQGSNLYASYTSNGDYVVYSYGPHWPLLIYTNGVWFANKDKRSRTTSRHFSQCRPDVQNSRIKLRWLSTWLMQYIACSGFLGLIKTRLLGETV
jgi:hypothetical protein